MKHSAQPVPTRHEIEIYQRRTERNSENQRLIKLKLRLQQTLQEQQPQTLARAS
jgi:hypothetical protein